MNKEAVQKYTARVAESNRTGLVVVIYDIILASLREAEKEMESGRKEEFRHELERAACLVRELMESLDYYYPISFELQRLYRFINSRICFAIGAESTDSLDGLDRVIDNLRQAFKKLSKDDHSGPVMQNTQKVYAGLTYGKEALSEISAIDGNRGFQA